MANCAAAPPWPAAPIAQAVEELGLPRAMTATSLRQLVRETAELVAAAKACRSSEDLALAVKALEGRQSEAERCFGSDQTCGNRPRGARKRAPQYNYNPK